MLRLTLLIAGALLACQGHPVQTAEGEWMLSWRSAELLEDGHTVLAAADMRRFHNVPSGMRSDIPGFGETSVIEWLEGSGVLVLLDTRDDSVRVLVRHTAQAPDARIRFDVQPDGRWVLLSSGDGQHNRNHPDQHALIDLRGGPHRLLPDLREEAAERAQLRVWERLPLIADDGSLLLRCEQREPTRRSGYWVRRPEGRHELLVEGYPRFGGHVGDEVLVQLDETWLAVALDGSGSRALDGPPAETPEARATVSISMQSDGTQLLMFDPGDGQPARPLSVDTQALGSATRHPAEVPWTRRPRASER